MNKPYRTTIVKNGISGEIAIRDAEGRRLAFVSYWGQHGAGAEADAKLIVDALNAYQPEE